MKKAEITIHAERRDYKYNLECNLVSHGGKLRLCDYGCFMKVPLRRGLDCYWRVSIGLVYSYRSNNNWLIEQTCALPREELNLSFTKYGNTLPRPEAIAWKPWTESRVKIICPRAGLLMKHTLSKIIKTWQSSHSTD